MCISSEAHRNTLRISVAYDYYQSRVELFIYICTKNNMFRVWNIVKRVLRDPNMLKQYVKTDEFTVHPI